MQSWGLALCSSLLLFFLPLHAPRGILRCVAHVVAGLGSFFSVFFVLQWAWKNWVNNDTRSSEKKSIRARWSGGRGIGAMILGNMEGVWKISVLTSRWGEEKSRSVVLRVEIQMTIGSHYCPHGDNEVWPSDWPSPTIFRKLLIEICHRRCNQPQICRWAWGHHQELCISR